MADEVDRDTGAFSELEEAFFREGDAASEVQAIETTFEPPRASLWSRLFKRAPRAPIARHATSPGI